MVRLFSHICMFSAQVRDVLQSVAAVLVGAFAHALALQVVTGTATAWLSVALPVVVTGLLLPGRKCGSMRST